MFGPLTSGALVEDKGSLARFSDPKLVTGEQDRNPSSIKRQSQQIPEPPAYGYPATGRRGLYLRRDPTPPLRAQSFFFQGDLQSLGLGHLVGQELLQLRVLPIELAQDADYLLGGASCLLNR